MGSTTTCTLCYFPCYTVEEREREREKTKTKHLWSCVTVSTCILW